jgi:predicted DNA-binding transcriptional regulator AlpA
MSEVQPEIVRSRPRRLISLQEACMRRGISVRSYWRDTAQLPSPVRGKGKHLFLEEEVDNLIDGLLAARTGT